jgi:hypothetical protein
MKTNKIRLFLPCCIALCALLLATGAMRANAQAPGQHPAYLHAITDLRHARALLRAHFGNPTHAQAASAALAEIDHAIGDLKHAAGANGLNEGEEPPADASLPPLGRFHRAYDYLRQAHTDAIGHETDPNAVPSRDGAIHHIDAATQIIGGVLK